MADQLTVITDTSLLVNFLAIDQVALLLAVPGHRFVVTDHVRNEVTLHYAEQFQRLASVIESGTIAEISVTDPAEVESFAVLTKTGLGIGECSAIAVAANRGHAIAIDDKTARNRIARLYPALQVLTTEVIVVQLIQASILTVAEADAIKADWQANHRFTLPFSSFSERLS